MNFKEAKDKLKEIADGRYHSVFYEITERTNGTLQQQVGLYIDEVDWYSAETWEEAFELLSGRQKEIKPIEIEDIEEVK